MNRLNKFRVTYQNGKETKKDHVNNRSYMDSTAEALTFKSANDTVDARELSKKGKIVSIDVYEEESPIVVEAQKKAISKKITKEVKKDKK